MRVIDSFLTVADVAKRLTIGDEQVLGFIKTGKLRASNVGLGAKRPRWRIDPADLETFLASRRNSQPAPSIRRNRRKKLSGVIEFF